MEESPYNLTYEIGVILLKIGEPTLCQVLFDLTRNEECLRTIIYLIEEIQDKEKK